MTVLKKGELWEEDLDLDLEKSVNHGRNLGEPRRCIKHAEFPAFSCLLAVFTDEKSNTKHLA